LGSGESGENFARGWEKKVCTCSSDTIVDERRILLPDNYLKSKTRPERNAYQGKEGVPFREGTRRNVIKKGEREF